MSDQHDVSRVPFLTIFLGETLCILWVRRSKWQPLESEHGSEGPVCLGCWTGSRWVLVSVTSKYQAGLSGGRLSEPGIHIFVCLCVSEWVSWRSWLLEEPGCPSQLQERPWGLGHPRDPLMCVWQWVRQQGRWRMQGKLLDRLWCRPSYCRDLQRVCHCVVVCKLGQMSVPAAGVLLWVVTCVCTCQQLERLRILVLGSCIKGNVSLCGIFLPLMIVRFQSCNCFILINS